MPRHLTRALVLGAAGALVLWLARAGAAPTVTFAVDPPNPVAGQSVQLRDTSVAGGSTWLWDFGDGASATQPAPAHSWPSAGTYTVHLTTQGATAEQTLTVSDPSALRLLAVHPFEISIQVKDPTTGAASAAQAVAVTDRFGWFSFPTLTHDPGNPEVTVKVLEAPTFGHYWIFWSAMTSLHYTMTVRDVSTGQVQVYEKNDDSPCGSWDTESFPFMPTPTPGPGGGSSPTPPPPTATNVPGQPTRTRTPTPTATPTGAPSATPTASPTPGTTQITLRVISWQWDWCAVDIPCQAGSCPYTIGPKDPMGLGQNGITLHQGCTYTLVMYNGDSAGGEFLPHEMNGVPELGIPDTQLNTGAAANPITLTVTAPLGDYSFQCKNTSCGDPTHHEGMLGLIHVVP